MLAKDLIKILKGYEDFEIQISILVKDNSVFGCSWLNGSITGIADIGVSDKVIVLENDTEVNGILHYNK